MESEDDRLVQVHEWQKYYNMEPRHDSTLTKKFVKGEVTCHPSVIARELVATDFIYKHTLYGELIEDFFRHLAFLITLNYKLDWKPAYVIVREYGSIALKLLMIIHSGIVVPERLPEPSDPPPPPPPTPKRQWGDED